MLTISSTYSRKSCKNIRTRKIRKKNIALLTLKILSSIACIKFLIFILKENKILIKIAKWKKDFKIKFKLSLFLDKKFIFFSTTALIVSWSIIEFSIYYMKEDPLSKKFYRLLMIFLLKMLILTASKNIFIFFIGWEGVGFLSFLLIRWWFTRKDAKTSALQAIIYNRIGDIGIILLLTSILILSKGWKISKIKFLNKTEPSWQNFILFSSLIAAIGKSAQFSLHPWLPAAMEGPTPVSALLHRSTMVVAGVFLLIRITRITKKKIFLFSCSIIGALTAIFAATSAFRQNDIKKIIAYSTTSQLGLMVVAIGTGKPNIALFHICTHAFFKAMLFLCSGRIIHRHKKEQDLRNISNIKSRLPITSACLLLGSIRLMGIPFLRGFFSKDLILESIIENPKKVISFFLAIRATFLTAAYSFRIITFCTKKKKKKKRIKPLKEENPKLYLPLIRLALGTIISGWFLSNWLIQAPSLFPKRILKSLPFVVTLIGALIASSIILTLKTNFNIVFFSNTWFYQKVAHSITNQLTSKIALLLSTRTLDRGWKETLGGQGIFVLKNKMSQNTQTTQSGYIKQYFLSLIIIFSCFSIILIIL